MPSIWDPYRTGTETGVSNFRRVRHSLSNWARGAFKRGDKGEIVGEIADQANNAAGVAGLGVGIAMAAGAAGGFVTIASGPGAAIVLGVIGLGLLAKSMYSNREKAHKKLTKHVWSIINDSRPAEIPDDEKAEVAAAALSLLQDGKNQLKILSDKYNRTQTDFDRWIQALNGLKATIDVKTARADQLKTEFDGFSRRNQLPQMKLACHNAIVNVTNAEKTYAKYKKSWADAEKRGKPLFDYLRRLSHISNYAMAGHVFTNYVLSKFDFTGELVGRAAVDDPWEKCPTIAKATGIRKALIDLEQKKNDVDEAWEQWATAMEPKLQTMNQEIQAAEAAEAAQQAAAQQAAAQRAAAQRAAARHRP